MSIGAHLEALRPTFTSYFEKVTAGVADAKKIELLHDDLKEASHVLLSELVNRWCSLNNLTMRVPDEVLALCFTLLPFRDRVFASHVSQRWRAISLRNPAIWAHIGSDIPRRHKPKLFALALGRTGNHAVDVLDCPDQHDIIEDLLVEHMRHIRSLYYPRVAHLAPLSCPAPRLETFVCSARGPPLVIAADFLGGNVGRLRKLQLRRVSFPETCPALSTVTELFLEGPTSLHYGMHFSQLFQLFPVLQSLTLLALMRSVSAALPVGPLPASLRYLCLSSSDVDHDLTRLYADWSSEALSHVEISHNAALSQHLVCLVDGAHTLDVLREHNDETSVITTRGPGSRYCSLEYWEEAADQHVLAALLKDLSSAIRNVCAMNIPATSLASFLAVFTVLPELARLTLTIDGHRAVPNGLEFHWVVLKPLARLEHRGKLRSLVLHVSSSARPHYTPSGQDAEALIVQLATLAHARLPDITVTGFPATALRDLSMPVFSGFNVTFDPTDEPSVS